MSKHLISRRHFLKGALAAGAGLALNAAGIPMVLAQEEDPTQWINLFDTGVELPTDATTFRMVTVGDNHARFWNAFAGKYQETYPNISVQYDGLPWNEIAQVVPLGVRGGNAHDMFYLPLNVTLSQAIDEGWIRALDDVVPNFEEIKANYPPGIFLEGLYVFDGKTYTLPIVTTFRSGTLLLYNRQYLNDAGYDPTDEPLTADEFRDAARKITEAGNGRYFGFIIGGNQPNRWAQTVRSFANIAGLPTVSSTSGADDIDFRTGEYVYDDDRMVEAIELLLALRDDGSVFPGSLSINAPEARARMPQGAAGMILQGPWNVPIWQRDNPDFDFGIAHQPLLDPDTFYPLHQSSRGDRNLCIYSGIQEPQAAIAADIIRYIGTVEGQTAWAQIAGVGDGPIFPEATERAELNDLERRTLQLNEELFLVGPDPAVRNPDVALVNQEMRGISPNLAEVVQGIYTGQISDIRQALVDLKSRANEELDRAIAAAQANGANVSRDDYVFSNWNPLENYTQENYAEVS